MLGIAESATLSELPEHEFDGDSMPWTKPLNEKSRVNAAGDVISGRKPPTNDMSLDRAMDIAGNWRSSHGYPLHIVWKRLKETALKVDPLAVVPKRQKRLPSVAAKLKRFDSMPLSKMQDLGGCRAILENVKKVDELVKLYESASLEALEFVRKKDYINDAPGPKNDGYRSIHLIYKYQGNSQAGAYKGLQVEIQIRSQLQHAWATALEIIDTFTGQGLKSNAGEKDWRRFFALISTAMAVIERRPIVPDTPSDIDELTNEIKSLCDKINIEHVFLGLTAGMEAAPEAKFEEPSVKAQAYILTLDSQEKMTNASAFSSNKDAEESLLEMEKENINKPHIQSVMVSAESLHGLRTAYPNYYFDTARFLGFVDGFTDSSARTKPFRIGKGRAKRIKK